MRVSFFIFAFVEVLFALRKVLHCAILRKVLQRLRCSLFVASFNGASGPHPPSADVERETRIELAWAAWKAAALPLCYSRILHRNKWWAGKDLHLRRLAPLDLQSSPFGCSGTCPSNFTIFFKSWSWWRESNPQPPHYK